MLDRVVVDRIGTNELGVGKDQPGLGGRVFFFPLAGHPRWDLPARASWQIGAVVRVAERRDAPDGTVD